MELAALLAQPHLSVIARGADPELARIQALVEPTILVDDRGDLERVLGRLLAAVEGAGITAGSGRAASPAHAAALPRTLDLIGHSTPERSLLLLGSWVIDGASAKVTAFFRGLADLEVLPRLGIQQLRLLGCQTAATRDGRATIGALAEILGVEVLGTREMISAAHYTARGFADEARHLLVSSRELRFGGAGGQGSSARLVREAAPSPRMLDIDALPSSPLGERRPWPQRIASSEGARKILRLVRCNAGAEMPGLVAPPSCEIALPSDKPNWYRLAQILLDGALFRVYPDGDRSPGIVYPVADPHALRAILDELPLARVG